MTRILKKIEIKLGGRGKNVQVDKTHFLIFPKITVLYTTRNIIGFWWKSKKVLHFFVVNLLEKGQDHI